MWQWPSTAMRATRTSGATSATQRSGSGRRGGFLTRGRRFLEGLSEEPARRYGRWMAHFAGAEKARLCTPEFLAAAPAADDLAPLLTAYREGGASDPADAAMAA